MSLIRKPYYFAQSLFKGHERSVRAKKNIALSFVFKGCSIFISLLLVPVTLKYLNSTEYGIWLTLSSILTWINFFDIGLGNGLRNKLTEALTINDIAKAKIYVSTTFAILTLIMALFFITFLTINPFLDWAKILNTPAETVTGLSSIVVVVFAFFCLQFVFKTVGIIFIAVQKPAMNDLLSVLGSALSLAIIYLLTLFTKGSLYYVAFTFSLTPVIVFVIAYFVIFYSKYKYLRPSFSTINFKYSKDLMGLGMKFFILQITGLLLFTTSNIIITQILGPEQVTVYNIAFKYFSVITMVFAVFTNPLWNAYTEAWVRNDIVWIRNSIKRSFQIWGLLAFLSIIMVVLANWIYRHWVGTDIHVPFGLTIGCAIYVTIVNWNNVFTMFVNGIGKIYFQFIFSIVNFFVFVPVAIFCTWKFGITGMVVAMSSILCVGSILIPIQYYHIITFKAKGFFYK